MRIAHRFDWDQGNLEHTARHGVSASEIEYLFYNDPMVSPDPYPSNFRALHAQKGDRKL